jgi:low-density lipoprotein receptor-related protein 4
VSGMYVYVCFDTLCLAQISCTCIAMEKRCDGVADCAEAEDEAGCARSCDEHENRTICHSTNVCIALDWICDGDNDCGDFSDETHCGWNSLIIIRGVKGYLA